MISIIIPTFNEADQIASTINRLKKAIGASDVEIIVSDGGSMDGTILLAKESGACVSLSKRKGRAAQMNTGAALAKGDLLYFLHADTIPPEGFLADIVQAVTQGYAAGCFMLSFDYPHWFLKANCWFTRFDVNALRFGDQSLFVTKASFEQAGGFCEQHIVLEDQELIKRLRKQVRFKVIKKAVVTSARKYLENGIYRTQGIFFIIYLLYRIGFSQQKLVRTYKKLIRQDKL
ncbi:MULTISPECIES: TIGR04283 family arsenosugar biosynthesis glycosyltransferase [unclassified Mucilaginibacter]|uniref:TIGR04283 family arsenosugar biosynthesis glycosyltransferase n=1 Tax=unclassified Mucilaginibacter TaxID=2617802 RepID=UPI002AC9718F|nr:MULTISPECIES: TIGR04283 family arsenosugar biosynthesis glycosyltransferase [unclassified Mucilaginibacter]MEB0260281.1 TIGR04283 family arsenosugar biosynthesis glycosyltransferase [Mucilaginibacter sp. 10I4]MEB0277308.1 TIGR04283 family arsenosugar biosynthesis glycosyltransferase [Mucilaginibacter sp. 10B2]MEB0302159.1 TIGR04283 family arsenosugar biosynthesis glycosyltransferase [Mucilaginibacter sp. 5C4]WPX25434.1 TIGR04283 family arsenosugar biosynthesis glycosyltransferase [Mucilagini